MSSVIPDTVSPSFFIFSAAISVCFTSSISSQVRSSYSDGRPFWRKSFITSPKIPYFSPALSPRYNSSKLICAISAPPLQYTTVPQFGAEVQGFIHLNKQMTAGLELFHNLQDKSHIQTFSPVLI